eukprot:CAMPEP_0194672414 /NCGR_PEP_ID=MMETSP0295-20121207/6440_1 /TAXON_ID=39354 /ORGANISM="Heterosigma akashiwo, Strain CCMP2393" /LENGTH=32 /DNA_ID= /DNA_START= /DNA_END= /DNA_ORIENTATION=
MGQGSGGSTFAQKGRDEKSGSECVEYLRADPY